jgi:hypothetical protein
MPGGNPADHAVVIEILVLRVRDHASFELRREPL